MLLQTAVVWFNLAQDLGVGPGFEGAQRYKLAELLPPEEEAAFVTICLPWRCDPFWEVCSKGSKFFRLEVGP